MPVELLGQFLVPVDGHRHTLRHRFQQRGHPPTEAANRWQNVTLVGRDLIIEEAFGAITPTSLTSAGT
jgi:hypothetical protein